MKQENTDRNKCSKQVQRSLWERGSLSVDPSNRACANYSLVSNTVWTLDDKFKLTIEDFKLYLL